MELNSGPAKTNPEQGVTERDSNSKHPQGHLGHQAAFLHAPSMGRHVFISKLKVIETAISFGT